VDVCGDPRDFEAALSSSRPDLILMDIVMPGVSGYDLARFVRQDERHATLPIVFLSTRAELDAQIEGARAGGDAHLEKPVSPVLLLATVVSRVERSVLLRTLLRQDGLTRLLTHSAFAEEARLLHARLGRAGGDAVWVMLDIDHFKQVNDRFGHPVGDRVLMALSDLLRRRLRATDRIGRYGGEEFAILLEGLAAVTAQTLVARLLEDFAAVSHAAADGTTFQATFSAGVAAWRPGLSLDDWRRGADDALYAAKRAGRSRVEIASPPE
jgi:diguanylate cyclase (GGDEF)-like protein